MSANPQTRPQLFLNEANRWAAKRLFHQGLDTRAIADRLGVPESAVWNARPADSRERA